jgi:hypothetical protein
MGIFMAKFGVWVFLGLKLGVYGYFMVKIGCFMVKIG